MRGPPSFAIFHKIALKGMEAKVMVPRTEPGKSPPVVAVVDDDAAVCNSLKFALELEGFSVRTYASGAELLRAGDIAKCDCFVVDERMPGMNGLEVIAQMRDRHVSAPAILIISQPSARVSERAAKSHVPIVEKPLLGNTLVEQIREACSGRSDSETP
jgi:two-component system, LuxR family, response regulator FixJ